MLVSAYEGILLWQAAFVSCPLSMAGCAINIGQGSRFSEGLITLRDCYPLPLNGVNDPMFSEWYGDKPEIENTAGVGLLIDQSRVWIDELDISNCGSHAIEAINSQIKSLSADLTGSGNTGAGVYAHSGSVVHIANGAAPVITGSLAGGADLSTDGTAQASTWAAIDGGTPVADTNEMTIAKEA